MIQSFHIDETFQLGVVLLWVLKDQEWRVEALCNIRMCHDDSFSIADWALSLDHAINCLSQTVIIIELSQSSYQCFTDQRSNCDLQLSNEA